MAMHTVESIPLPTIRRYPSYVAIVHKARQAGVTHISSTAIALELGLEPIQVRKDLAACGAVGRPRRGFALKELLKALNKAMGLENTREAFLVGAGNLGSALAGYKGFERWGLRIVGLFDSSSRVIGKRIYGIEVLSTERLPELAHRMGVRLGILTVPSERARQAAALLLAGGIEGIWNFTGVRLQVGPHVVVEQVDLAASLVALYNKLSEQKERRGE
ncbi:MAG: redox-sensing transcriptional repressor Rex [Chitinivibrionales bacterium]|nr:redox-sensing transcriptional repressor Rex [Chitinivibrionales bacterium]MBD3357000.1 redox-sensing transcriptional repressor Rex [Chitinivibrionales bacterium]